MAHTLTKLINYCKLVLAKLRKEEGMSTFIFGYGSLLNIKSLQGTVPGKTHFGWVDLTGYRRVFNKAGLQHAYLNMRQEERSVVRGVLVQVNPTELALFAQREQGYELVEVTDRLAPVTGDERFPGNPLPKNAKVYTFVAPGLESMPVRGSYLKRVLEGLPEKERDRWIRETDFQGREVDETS